MIFNSIDFLVFFCIAFSIYFFVPQKFKWAYLLAASYIFYGYWNPAYLLLLIIPTILIYFISLKLNGTESKRKRKLLLITGLFFGLAGLLIYKYTDFIGASLYSLGGFFISDLKYKPFNLLLPIGISFYTFKLVSYLMDVYNEKTPAEKHMGYFALYISFFPQLLMGPIDRAINLIPELKKKVTFDVDRIVSGFRLVVYGLFKKMVIADRLAIFVNEIFSAPEQQGIHLLFGAYFYAFQIYCDFSGYSDIAIGLARMLGFKSMDNFDFPYFSKSMTQFWNKWHISLSTWLRDYLFLPIAYAVMRPIKTPKLYNIKAETWGYVVGMFTTMFLGGLWHGAGWTYVIWGMLHGIYLGVGYTTKKTRKRWAKKIKLTKLPRLRSFISIFITFNLVSFAWIFFRAETFEKAMTYIKHIGFGGGVKGTVHLYHNLGLLLLFILMEVFYKYKESFQFTRKIPAAIKIAGFALFICLMVILAVDTSNEFIYLKF
jgi:D-alanyl-lipoteichoic acid acyltransferase DltB (MBOAT superfamily)